MNIIAAVDKHWAIGNRRKLLVTIPDDQKLFREETKGKVIVMGRKTLESLPGESMSFSRETSLTGQRGVRSFMISLQPWNI